MPVTARKLSPAWRRAFAQYERLSGFEMLHQAEIDAGEMTPYEAWHNNIRWLEDMLAEVQHIKVPDDLR